MRIVSVNLLSPVWRVRPDEIECGTCGQAAEAVCVGGVKAVANVTRQARDGKLAAHVRTGAAAGHRVKDVLGVEEKKQVTDEPAAAITGVTAVAIFTGAAEVIEAGQMRHRAGIQRCQRKPGINRLSGGNWLRKRDMAAMSVVKRIDDVIGLHGENSFEMKGGPRGRVAQIVTRMKPWQRATRPIWQL